MTIACAVISALFGAGAVFCFLYLLYLWSKKGVEEFDKLRHD